MKSDLVLLSTISLPDSAKTRDGYLWNPQVDHWRIATPSGPRSFDFNAYAEICDRQLVDSSKYVFMHILFTHSAHYAANLSWSFCRFLRWASNNSCPINTITVEMIFGYRMSLATNQEYYLACLRAFFERWSVLGAPCLDSDVVTEVDKLRLRGNPKGVAVLTADPGRGPFSDIEFQAIIARVNEYFGDGKISAQNYILIWLLLALGVRPVQLAMLKACDFHATECQDGNKVYHLNMPRGKQRKRGPRTTFKVRKLIGEIGELMEGYIHVSGREWVSRVGIDVKNMPIFINYDNEDSLELLRFHMSSTDISLRIKSVFQGLGVQSERTGGPIPVSTRRFRYTHGTRAAKEGASEYVIAELLDHSDVSNVGIYVQAVPEISDRIDRAMALHYAPLAKAFGGRLIEGECQEIRGDDSASRIAHPSQPRSPLGNCGCSGACHGAVPSACYTCRSFQPWLNHSHDEILDELLEQRQRIIDETGDLTIASVNDRTILACAEVVRQCLERSGEQK